MVATYYYSVDGVVVVVRRTCSHSRSVRLSITRPAVSAARGAARETPRRTDLPVFSAASAAINVVADEWTEALQTLQAAGEVIVVRLPGGFYGVCLLPRYDRVHGR
ncbi:MAG TPA: hypothetical protein VGZ23_04495 [bacterium]|nr:hypothetical protein [bacterium]